MIINLYASRACMIIHLYASRTCVALNELIVYHLVYIFFEMSD